MHILRTMCLISIQAMILYGGNDYDATSYNRLKLYENTLWNNDAENRDVYVIKSGIAQNFCVRYYWLHGLHKMVNYITKKGVSYKTIADENDSNYIAISCHSVEICRTEIGTFNASDKNTDDTDSTNQTIDGTKRALSAFKSITKYDTTKQYDGVLLSVQQELQAAYDYAEKKPVYGGDVYILDDYNTKLNYSESQINQYRTVYGARYGVSQEEKNKLKEAWENKTNKTDEEMIKEYEENTSNEDIDRKKAQESDNPKIDKDKDTIYVEPKNNTAVATSGPDDVINDAESFITDGNRIEYMKTDELQSFSQTLYSILFGLGVIISVIIGLILGVKLMLAPVGERADAKKLLIPYVIGCAVVFGAFGIWKLVVTIMQGI